MARPLPQAAPGHELEFGHHPGEEFVHVVEGELQLEVEGVEPRLLGAGDSAYYQGIVRTCFATRARRGRCGSPASTRRRRRASGTL